jgi:hypothetical protein
VSSISGGDSPSEASRASRLVQDHRQSGTRNPDGALPACALRKEAKTSFRSGGRSRLARRPLSPLLDRRGWFRVAPARAVSWLQSNKSGTFADVPECNRNVSVVVASSCLPVFYDNLLGNVAIPPSEVVCLCDCDEKIYADVSRSGREVRGL